MLRHHLENLSLAWMLALWTHAAVGQESSGTVRQNLDDAENLGHVLSDRGSHDIVVGDIDADGDLDIVGANHAGKSHPLELWRNELKSP